MFITAEIKYHSFVDVPKELIIVDAGHYETEQFIKISLRKNVDSETNLLENIYYINFQTFQKV